VAARVGQGIAAAINHPQVAAARGVIAGHVFAAATPLFRPAASQTGANGDGLRIHAAVAGAIY
jgi:hypothetical protein